MNIEEQLKQIILERYKSVRAFAQTFDIPYSTLDSVLKRGIQNAGIGTIIKIFDALDLDIESIKENNLKKASSLNVLRKNNGAYFNLSANEEDGIKKYRALDKYGKETVSSILECEYKRCQEQDKEELSAPLTGDIIYLPDPIQSASAGYGQLADDDTADMIAIQANPITSKAHYIMRVSGKSMEPKFFDGQRVLVRNQPTIEPGEIGIFIIGGERFIKTYRGDHLESTNPDYPDVPVDNYSKCIGKVLGILQDDWIVK